MAGRPRSFDRDDALDCAQHAFWEHGYDRTSIAQLTSAMGIAAPSLYAAFGDKRALFDEAVARYLERLDAEMETGLAEPTARAAVEHLLRAAAAFYTEAGHPRGCLVMSEPLLLERREASREAIGARIRQGVEAGDVPAGTDARELAEFYDVVIAGLSARARDGVGPQQLQAAVDRALAAWPT